jgi:hypothetical protein
MIIDSLAELNWIVKRAPFLAQLVPRMCAFLTQISQINHDFQASEEQSLGHLEDEVKRSLGNFLAEATRLAAQQKADQTPPKCPKCGRGLTRRRKTERTVQTLFGEVKLTRMQGFCAKCKEWFCPGDEALGVESGYSPGVQEAAALLASKMPLSEASAVMERLTGRKLPITTLDRVASGRLKKRRTNANRAMNRRALERWI